jgi:hypothetical protein
MRVCLTSPWIPAEWIRAHGLKPHALWAEHPPGCGPQALSAGICAFADEAVRFAETHPTDAVIFTTACDQMRRGFDTTRLGGQQRTFLFNLPATQSPAAELIYRAELERLGEFLIALGGIPPSPEKLRREMSQADVVRHQLRETAPAASVRAFAKSVAEFLHDGTFSAPAKNSTANSIPLALVGGPLAEADWALFDVLEQAGGRIVLNATKSGERSLCPEFSENGVPLDTLAAGYFEHITDVFQRPNTRLYAWLKPRLAARGVRGIVLRQFTGCDLWRAEWQTLRETFGRPVLLLEADEAIGLSPRDRTRLEAFIEMLKAEG